MTTKERERLEKILEGRKRPSMVCGVLVGADVVVEDGRAPRIVKEERADIPVEVWDTFWQRAYKTSVTRKRIMEERAVI